MELLIHRTHFFRHIPHKASAFEGGRFADLGSENLETLSPSLDYYSPCSEYSLNTWALCMYHCCLIPSLSFLFTGGELSSLYCVTPTALPLPPSLCRTTQNALPSPPLVPSHSQPAPPCIRQPTPTITLPHYRNPPPHPKIQNAKTPNQPGTRNTRHANRTRSGYTEDAEWS